MPTFDPFGKKKQKKQPRRLDDDDSEDENSDGEVDRWSLAREKKSINQLSRPRINYLFSWSICTLVEIVAKFITKVLDDWSTGRNRKCWLLVGYSCCILWVLIGRTYRKKKQCRVYLSSYTKCGAGGLSGRK